MEGGDPRWPRISPTWVSSPKAGSTSTVTRFCGSFLPHQVAKDCGVKLMTAFQRRFDPSFSRLQAMIKEGEVGEPVSAVLQSRDPAAPPFDYVKGGGGLFKDMGGCCAFVLGWRALMFCMPQVLNH